MTELEEYARQYEVTGRGSRGARATPAATCSGRESVATITSSCRDSVLSDSSADTLRPSVTSSPLVEKRDDSRGSHTAGAAMMVGQHNNELRDRGSVYTKMRPVFNYNDGRRKSDFYSFSNGGYYNQVDHRILSNDEGGLQSLQQSGSHAASVQEHCSVMDRIHQMEKLGSSQNAAGNITPRHHTTNQDDFHLSKSVPNLLSENEDGQQKDPNITVDTGLDNSAAPSYTYLDPEKKLKVTDNTLKLIQKQAVLDYYTRQKKSSTDLTKEVTRRVSMHNRSDTDDSSKNSSFECERKFLRSISQGSLSGLSPGHENGESFVSLKQSPGRQQSSPPRQLNFSPTHHEVICPVQH